MADNIEVTAGSGKTIAADDVGGALYQRVKIAAGADGVATDVSAAAPLPVTDGNSADILTAAQAIQAAIETLDNIVSGAEAQVDIVSGNVGLTGNLPDTATGDLAAMVTALGNLLTELQSKADVGETQPVSATTLPLPTGAATAANQTTIAGLIDGIEALLATIDADTGTLAGAVDTEVQVDVVGALPAGDNNIGNVDIASALPAGANNIGDVDVASIAAGENVIGLVGASDIVVTITPTLAAEAHSAGDLLFDSTEIANAVRVAAGTAIVQSITVVDKGDQKPEINLLFANAATDFGTLGAAPDPDDTEAATVIGVVNVPSGDYVDLGGASVATVSNVGLLLKAGAATTSLYLAGIAVGTPTPASTSDLVISIGLLRS